MGLNVGVDGGDQAARKSAALADLDANLPVEFQRTIREHADALAEQARQKAEEEPAHGTRHTGLRDAVAAGVDVQDTPTGVKVTTSMPEQDEAAIPRGFDDPVKGWRHPVFGRANSWVQQTGAFSWFTDTMAAGSDDIRDGLVDDINTAIDAFDSA